MQSLQFDPQLRLGIAEIDDQHQQIIDLINQARELAASQDTEAPDMLQILIKLRDLTLQHFTSEELLMAQYGYPQLKEHRQLHDSSVEKTFNFDGATLVDNPQAIEKLLALLQGWLVMHIEEDKEMVRYLRQKGAQ